MNSNRLSTSAFVETRGLLVSSENVTIMASPSVNPTSSPVVRPSGSAACSNVIVGPGLAPKFPVSARDSSVEIKDEFSASLRFPLGRRVTVNTPVVGQAKGTLGSQAPALTIVITRVAGSTKTPV